MFATSLYDFITETRSQTNQIKQTSFKAIFCKQRQMKIITTRIFLVLFILQKGYESPLTLLCPSS